MFIKSPGILPDEVAIVKVLAQAPGEKKPSFIQAEDPVGPTLEIQGFSDGGEILFQYVNEKQDIAQTFGLNVKKYHGHDGIPTRVNR